MNPFFGPAGQQFDSSKAQLNRNETAVLDQISRLKQYDVDQWLDCLASLFVAGMREGIHVASGNRETRFSSNPVVSVQVDQANEKEVEKQTYIELVKYLNNPDSVEFATMDQAITMPIMARNQIQDLDTVTSADQLELQLPDLFNVFLSGWQFGYQNFVFRFHHRELNEAADYRKAGQRAQRALKMEHLNQYQTTETRAYLMIRILNVMTEKLMNLTMTF